MLFRSVEAPPPLLGFECARWIADNRGKYDYFVYLEDDICLRDPLMFVKLDAFYGAFGAARPDILLQPQRYEETVVARHHGFAERFDRLYKHLGENKVRLSIRRGMLRFSLHAYNNMADVERVLDLSRKFLASNAR